MPIRYLIRNTDFPSFCCLQSTATKMYWICSSLPSFCLGESLCNTLGSWKVALVTHLPPPKNTVAEHPVLLLHLSHTKLHSKYHCSLLGLIVWFSFSLENHLPFRSAFHFLCRTYDLHLGWLPGWLSRTFLQQVPGSIIWTLKSFPIYPSQQNHSTRPKHLIIITQSLAESDGSKPESRSTQVDSTQSSSPEPCPAAFDHSEFQ